MLNCDQLTDDELGSSLRSAFGSLGGPAGALPADPRRLADRARRARRRHRAGLLAGTGTAALAAGAALAVPALVATPHSAGSALGPDTVAGRATGPLAGAPVPSSAQGSLRRISLAGYTVTAALPAGTRTDEGSCAPVTVTVPGVVISPGDRTPWDGSPCLSALLAAGLDVAVPADAQTVVAAGHRVRVAPRPDGGFDAVLADGAVHRNRAYTPDPRASGMPDAADPGQTPVSFVVGSRGLSARQVADATAALEDQFVAARATGSPRRRRATDQGSADPGSPQRASLSEGCPQPASRSWRPDRVRV